MPTYEDWNRALVSHFLEGAPHGSSIFLTVDDDVLNTVAARSGLEAILREGNVVDDFCYAVQRRVTRPGQEFDIAGISRGTDRGEPECVGFLAAMVLAASRMASQLAEGEPISELNYFRRLREVLGLDDKDGRPAELPTGWEEPAWLAWNRWLQRSGFLPTARKGSGPRKYIEYPISQTLLREADKERLRRLFRDRHWTSAWDSETLFTQVKHEAASLNQHLRELMASKERQRLQAVAEAVGDLYEVWQAESTTGSPHARYVTGNIYAGIYRVQDSLLGSIEYYLYPRQRRGRYVGEVVVETSSGPQALAQDRRGWYRPLAQLESNALNHGVRWAICSPSELQCLVLPAREFWILVPDQENVDSGIYASWGTPRLGVHFIILCRLSLLSDLQRLRDERLIEWAGEPREALRGADWIEITECQVTSEAWSGVFTENKELLDQLRPRISLDISVSGGLRVPDGAGWIQDHGPHVTVFGFRPEVDVLIINIENERPVYRASHKANEPIPVPWALPGDFRIQATAGADIDERLVKIVDRDHVFMRRPDEPQAVSVGPWRIHGASVEEAP